MEPPATVTEAIPASLLTAVSPGSAAAEGATIREDTRATLIVAAALLSLRDQGAVDLEVEHGKRLFIKYTHVKVTAKAPVAGSTVEAALAAAATRKAEAKDVVAEWLGGYFENPWAGVYTKAARSGVDFGLYAEVQVDAEGVIAKAMHKQEARLRQVEDRVAALTAQLQALAERWVRFRQEERDLHDALLDRVHAGIGSRKLDEGDDGPDVGG